MELLNDSPQDEQTNENENMETEALSESVPVTEPVEETIEAEETAQETTEEDQSEELAEDSEEQNEEMSEEEGETLIENPFATQEDQTSKRKKRIIIGSAVAGVLVVAAVVIGLLFPNLFSGRGAVLATVGDDKIYVEDFQERVRYYRWQFINQYAQIYQIVQYFGDYDGNQQYQLDQLAALLDDSAYFGQIVLNSMMDEAILSQKAEEMGIVVTDEEVQDVIMTAFGYDPDAATEEAEASENALYADAEAQPTPYTEELFNENFSNYMADMALAQVSEEEFRQVQWISLIHNKLYEEITKDYVAGTEEQVWARHILVADEETALSVIEQLNSGEATFEDLAMEVSIDTGSGAYGGDLGWFGRGMMITEFEDAAFSLEVGEISEPVQSTYGFHIIEVLGHENRVLSEEEQETEKSQLFSDWLSTQTAVLNSSIEIDEELLAESVPTAPSLNDLFDETSPIYQAIFGVSEE